MVNDPLVGYIHDCIEGVNIQLVCTSCYEGVNIQLVCTSCYEGVNIQLVCTSCYEGVNIQLVCTNCYDTSKYCTMDIAYLLSHFLNICVTFNNWRISCSEFYRASC